MNESEWLATFEECRSSGLSIKQWCLKHGIKYNSYLYWVKKLQPQQWAQLPVQTIDESTGHNCVKLNCGKWTVIVDNETSIQVLRTVLKAVDEICC